MNDREFKIWLKKERLKKRKSKVKYIISIKKKGIVNIPNNF